MFIPNLTPLPAVLSPWAEDMGSWEARLGAGWPAALSVPGHCSLVLVEGLCTLGLTPGWWPDMGVSLFSLPLGTVGPILLAEDRGKVSCASQDTSGPGWPRAGDRAGLLGASWVVQVQP